MDLSRRTREDFYVTALNEAGDSGLCIANNYTDCGIKCFLIAADVIPAPVRGFVRWRL